MYKRKTKNDGMHWHGSKNPWVVDRIADETWVGSSIVNPAKNERTIDQALAANCLEGTMRRSGMIGMSYHPIWTKGSAKRSDANQEEYCSHLQMRQSIRPQKIIHSVGVTDHHVIVEIVNKCYLGVFRVGQHPAVIRLSLGVKPQVGGNAATNASFALKIPRDNIHACDILAMFDFDGQTTGNMFQHILGTNISNPHIEADPVEAGDKFQVKLMKKGRNRPGLTTL